MKNKGFTLIELLVVIGILSILAVALLIAINPAEAQRKARDTQRLKDVGSLQTAVEGWINDNTGSSLNVTSISTSGLTNCTTAGWLGLDVCNYMNKLPKDPRNSTTLTVNSTGGQVNTGAYYKVVGSAGVYNICTYLESKGNTAKIVEDGISNDVFNVYSSTAVTCVP